MNEVVIASYLRTAQSRSRPNDPGRDWFHKFRSDELLAMMALDTDPKKLTLEFSHGMQKKLALAAALIPNPDLPNTACLPWNIIARNANQNTEVDFLKSLNRKIYCVCGKWNPDGVRPLPNLSRMILSPREMNPAGCIAGVIENIRKCSIPGSCWVWNSVAESLKRSLKAE